MFGTPAFYSKGCLACEESGQDQCSQSSAEGWKERSSRLQFANMCHCGEDCIVRVCSNGSDLSRLPNPRAYPGAVGRPDVHTGCARGWRGAF